MSAIVMLDTTLTIQYVHCKLNTHTHTRTIKMEQFKNPGLIKLDPTCFDIRSPSVGFLQTLN